MKKLLIIIGILSILSCSTQDDSGDFTGGNIVGEWQWIGIGFINEDGTDNIYTPSEENDCRLTNSYQFYATGDHYYSQEEDIGGGCEEADYKSGSGTWEKLADNVYRIIRNHNDGNQEEFLPTVEFENANIMRFYNYSQYGSGTGTEYGYYKFVKINSY